MPLGGGTEIWYTESKDDEGDEALETATAKKGHLTAFLAICAVVALTALVVMTALSLPYFGQEDPLAPAAHTEEPSQEPTLRPTQAPTEEPTEAPTEPEPTLLPIALNPFGPLDFQFDGRYLKCLRTESVTGIDVSSHQQQIDWAKVKASGVEFAMIRIGFRGYESGKLSLDEYAEANLAGAAEAGLDIGVYFFSQALNTQEAEAEVKFVLDTIKDYQITMPVVYDWETVADEDARSHGMDARTLTDCSLTFLQGIEEAGYTPMLYFNSYQSQHLLYLEELQEYDFWLAMYTKRMDFPYQVKMWQYTDKGSVPGISGPADINIYFPNL